MADIRKLAHELLLSYEKEERYANLLLSSPKVKALSKEELSALTVLLYTTVEKKLKYDYIICAYAKRQTSDIDPFVLAALRLGLCQIYDMSSVPDFAAVNETVKLARHKGEQGFINAILRKAVREKDTPPLPDRAKNAARYMSVYYSVPLKTVKYFISLFGDDAERLLEAYSRPSSLSLTVNEGKISRDALLEKLSGLGYKCSPSRYSANGITFDESLPPKSIEGFSEGEFFVQDEASRIAAAALDARCGETVIDVCSAPGGKALAAAIKVGKEGCVYAFDLHESKLSLINDSKDRLGLRNLTVRSLDATVGCEELFGKADRVICDVPCSGLGVFAKKPDLRYKDIDTASELPALQLNILRKSAEYLKAGGVLVYSTCTLNPEENEGVTDCFIRENPDFTYEDFEVSDLKCKGKITLLPYIHGTDGFYIAKLRKLK